jgi:hypothetical protein
VGFYYLGTSSLCYFTLELWISIGCSPCYPSTSSRGPPCFSLVLITLSISCSRLWKSSGFQTIMDPQDFREVCRILRRHKEALSNNDLSIRSLLSIINNMERKNQEQYNKIMGILEKYGGKISEIEMDCYKLKCSIQYESDTCTSDTASIGPSTGQTEDKHKGKETGQHTKESKNPEQTFYSPGNKLTSIILFNVL